MKLKNTYYALRHGEAVSNVKSIMSSWPETFYNPLTPIGRKMARQAAKELAGKGINIMFASDLLRTKQTAQIVGKTLKLKVIFDTRLREISFGHLNGKSAEELLYLSFEKEKLPKSKQKAETYEQVYKRVKQFLISVEKKYRGQNILLVSHQCPLWIMEIIIQGLSLKDGLLRDSKEKRIAKGEVRKLAEKKT